MSENRPIETKHDPNQVVLNFAGAGGRPAGVYDPVKGVLAHATYGCRLHRKSQPTHRAAVPMIKTTNGGGLVASAPMMAVKSKTRVKVRPGHSAILGGARSRDGDQLLPVQIA